MWILRFLGPIFFSKWPTKILIFACKWMGHGPLAHFHGPSIFWTRNNPVISDDVVCCHFHFNKILICISRSIQRGFKPIPQMRGVCVCVCITNRQNFFDQKIAIIPIWLYKNIHCVRHQWKCLNAMLPLTAHYIYAYLHKHENQPTRYPSHLGTIIV